VQIRAFRGTAVVGRTSPGRSSSGRGGNLVRSATTGKESPGRSAEVSVCVPDQCAFRAGKKDDGTRAGAAGRSHRRSASSHDRRVTAGRKVDLISSLSELIRFAAGGAIAGSTVCGDQPGNWSARYPENSTILSFWYLKTTSPGPWYTVPPSRLATS